MTKNTKILIELIKNGDTINDIATALNLSHRQLYYRLLLLKNQGYLFKKNYYSNGEITLSVPNAKDLNDYLFHNNVIDIITKKSEDQIRLIVISDIHLCSKYDSIESLYQIYNYAKSNNINSIINCGDLIDGIGGCSGKPKEKDLLKQITYLIDNYPFDKNILNYTVLGNHDAVPLYHKGINLKEVLENKRLDIVPMGFSHSILRIKDSQIGLSHPMDHLKSRDKNIDLLLRGHSHSAKFSFSTEKIINVPSLSTIDMNNGKRLYEPQALDITLHFSNDTLEFISGYQLLVTKNDCYIVNEFNFRLDNDYPKTHNNKNIVEELPKSGKYTKVRTRKKFEKKYEQLS